MNQSTPSAALVLKNISKVFEGQRALDSIDFELRPGEVHALLGPNGSGKSTLIKILAGYHQPEDGAEAWLNGAPLEIGSPAGSKAIHFIHQDLGLVGDLDAVDNLALGSEYVGKWWLSDRRERAAAERRLNGYGVSLDTRSPVHALSRARQTMIAVIRAIGEGLKSGDVLVLDEPTASLPAHEVHQLFDLISAIRNRGGSVIYVTHRLGEVFDIADRITVLRDGRRVATLSTADLDHDRLVTLIVGRELGSFYPQPPAVGTERVLELRDIAGDGVADVSLAVHAGEIVGVSGLVGSGYEDLLQLAFGSKSRRSGEVLVDGRPVLKAAPHASIRAGVAFATADRKRLGAIMDWTVRENLTLAAIRGRGRAHWLGQRHEYTDALRWLDRLGVVPADPERRFSALSGGNQQKVSLARWLRAGARAYLLEEPTNGVDMGAKHAIYEMLVSVARDGSAVLMTSQDPDELCSICDRVVILRDGRIVASLTGQGVSEESIISASVGRWNETEGAL